MNNPNLIFKIVKYLKLEDIYSLSITNRENFQLLKPYGHIHVYIANIENGGSDIQSGFNSDFYKNKVPYMTDFLTHLDFKFSIQFYCTRIGTKKYQNPKSQYDPVNASMVEEKLIIKDKDIINFPSIKNNLYYKGFGCYKLSE